MANSYGFALLGEPIYQGYYTHHDMGNSQINFGPLWNADQPGLTRGTVPDTLIYSAGQNGAVTSFGLIVFAIYGGGCFALYWYLIKPELDDKWDRSDSRQKAYYDSTIVGYSLACYLFYYFVVAKVLGITPINILSILTGG